MIQARKLNYAVGNTIILRDVSATIAAGVITAIIGPNGAGKSTLLQCLTGTLQPDSGSVTLDDIPITKYSLGELAQKRAVLAQSTAISFPFTAQEIVRMGRHPYGTATTASADDIIQQAMASVEVLHLKTRIFPTLSGGEQQRVQLARVLAQLWGQQYACLFLDEPTAALDLKHQHQLCNIAQHTASNHHAVCIIMHDIHLALRYADVVILLKEGQVIDAGATSNTLTAQAIAEVFTVPTAIAHSYVQRVN